MTQDFQCDNCPKTALYVIIIQDLVKERDNVKDPPKFFCMEHTVKRVQACLAVPGRYSIIIEPTGAKQRTPNRKKKSTKTIQDDEMLAAEVNRFS